MKKKIIAIGFLFYSNLLYSHATIFVDGNVSYAIDGQVSVSTILHEGQTLTYLQGDGILKITDNTTKKSYILDKNKHSFSSKQKQNIFAGITGIFVKSSDLNSAVNAATKSENKCIDIEENNLIIDYDQDAAFFDLYRYKEHVIRYEIDRGIVKYYNDHYDPNFKATKGDKIVLRNVQMSIIKVYCIM